MRIERVLFSHRAYRKSILRRNLFSASICFSSPLTLALHAKSLSCQPNRKLYFEYSSRFLATPSYIHTVVARQFYSQREAADSRQVNRVTNLHTQAVRPQTTGLVSLDCRWLQLWRLSWRLLHLIGKTTGVLFYNCCKRLYCNVHYQKCAYYTQ